MQQDNRNMVVFVIAAAALMIVYQIFILGPAAKKRDAEQRAAQAVAAAHANSPTAPPVVITLTRAQALAQSPRAPISTPNLKGSIALKGGRIDDLYLTRYPETLAKNSPPVELLRPEGTTFSYFADFGWSGIQGAPDENAQWTLTQGQTLSPGHPVVLSYAAPGGIDFTRTIQVDDQFMFTITDTVANHSAAKVTLAPFGTVQRRGLPPDLFNAINVHQGAVGWLGGALQLSGYKDWKKKGQLQYDSTGGWAGITDKYWMAAIAPDQKEPVKAYFRVTSSPNLDIYDSSYLGSPHVLQPGQQTTETQHLFAGAKTVSLLDKYTKTYGIPELRRAIDWGKWVGPLTPIIFAVLEFFYQHVGNFGVAILLLTICVRLLMFFPANKGYESTTKMKKAQPEIDRIRARYKDDPQKAQQETFAYYQRERINPFLGCIMMLPTLPIFFALYKVLSVTIEMRHASFLWVPDLSASDPSTIWNLFGLLPYDPTTLPFIGGVFGGMLHIGVWALAYAFTTWLSQSMTPTTGMDQTQKTMMQWMPLIMMIFLARLTVGLLIYYTWSNLLTLLQQYVIMRRFGVENPIDNFIARVQGRMRPASG